VLARACGVTAIAATADGCIRELATEIAAAVHARADALDVEIGEPLPVPTPGGDVLGAAAIARER
jgi:hypothetical protein